jgi:hypothetical protein
MLRATDSGVTTWQIEFTRISLLMTLSELLESGVARLPKGPRTDPFATALRNTFDAYLNGIDCLDGTDYASAYVRSHRDLVALVADNVRTIHQHGIYGQPSHARRLLNDTLLATQEQIQALVSISVKPEDMRYLFRMRRAGSIPPVERQGIFHIPFQLRHLVGSQRYSVPGLPMLYLGSSLLVCWHEIGSPPLSDVWISRFEARQSLRVLNFGYRPDLVGLWIANHRDAGRTPVAAFAGHYAVLWPLLAACSFKAAYRVGPSAPFIEEYIVPQLLTSWLSEQAGGSIDGIRYFSTHLNRASPELCMNYVFVPRDVADLGYCSTLANRFALTEPMQWEYAVQLRSSVDGGTREDRSAMLYDSTGREVEYKHTGWGAMESQLSGMTRSGI